MIEQAEYTLSTHRGFKIRAFPCGEGGGFNAEYQDDAGRWEDADANAETAQGAIELAEISLDGVLGL